MHPVVVRSGRGAAFREHCQTRAELLHSHGSPERRQASPHPAVRGNTHEKPQKDASEVIQLHFCAGVMFLPDII